VLLHKRRFDRALELAQEVGFPLPQGARVVRADVEDGVDDEGVCGAGRYAVQELRYAGQVAAGEDVAADEIRRGVVGFVALRICIMLENAKTIDASRWG